MLTAALGPPDGAAGRLEEGLEAMRAGRFEEAELHFARLSKESPSAPEGPFFQAFEIWWKLLDRGRERPGMRDAMEERLAEAAARARLLRGSSDPSERERGSTFFGIARLLDAQSKASRGAHMAASSSARQGHRALSEAIEAHPSASDALFAMGAYNYYADKLPAVVKGLRFVLFIPGGDSDLGLRQLEQAADSSALFGTEALMLLAHIHSTAEPSDHRRAVGYIRRAARRQPLSPIVALGLADLLHDMGQLRASRRTAEEVAGSLHGASGYRRDLARYAEYRLAASLLESHDPLAALRRIEQAMDTLCPEISTERRRWMSLLSAAAAQSGKPERISLWVDRLAPGPKEAAAAERRAEAARRDNLAPGRALALAEAAAGRLDEALRRLHALREHDPLDTRLRYDLGRLLQEKGAFDQARPHLEAAAQGKDPELAGWALLRLGWEKERDGQRAQALPYYRKAAGMRRFNFQAAARDRLLHPRDDQPEG
ncbi:MAG TPA: tetratricopeptide repeat protein [Candidatus Polarisedimenticolia bacterium]|nr:tetratricopeptide repeat protein [Candidatus Polarisedimenticolia bacterium]